MLTLLMLLLLLLLLLQVLEYLREKGGVFGEGVTDIDKVFTAATNGDAYYVLYCVVARARYVVQFIVLIGIRIILLHSMYAVHVVTSARSTCKMLTECVSALCE
jgi:hypothetical protein